MQKPILNFSIIAHIDHGKSTLADRFLELTGTVSKRAMREQVLDNMELERERGITIKMQPVRMEYKGNILNLIDTPGHIDFSYEVSRALQCCEGAILLVDATQGIEAQTLSHYYLARSLGLTIIPVLNKIDLAHARTDEVGGELAALGGFERREILSVSAKNGDNVSAVLDAVVEHVKPPEQKSDKLRALVFDSYYDTHRGIVAYVRVFDGSVSRGERLFLKAKQIQFTARDTGVLVLGERPKENLGAGEIGYVVTGIKSAGEVRIGDTICGQSVHKEISALPGYSEPHPVVWATFFPVEQGDFYALGDALEKLHLNDSSLSFAERSSVFLGRGYECGFLGTLHLEIIAERLRREFGIQFIVTQPSVMYRVFKKNDRTTISSASCFPRKHEADKIEELWTELRIITPQPYLQDVVALTKSFEGVIDNMETLGQTRLELKARMPLRRIVAGFFDALKSATRGYASFSYGRSDWRQAGLQRIDVLVEGERVEVLSRVSRAQDAVREARKIVEKVKDVLPRELFAVRIQGEVEGRIVASATLKALRKDVTGYLYGGDRTRKMKLWKKQKEGKKKLRLKGRVNIDPDVFIKLLKV